jgi:hypothetical protein
MEDVNPLINITNEEEEILHGFLTPDVDGGIFYYGTPLIGLVNDYYITNEPFDDSPVEDELKVIPYDIEREIYKEINYGFLIKDTDHGIFCIGKVIDDVIDDAIEKLSDNDKKICESLKIKY